MRVSEVHYKNSTLVPVQLWMCSGSVAQDAQKSQGGEIVISTIYCTEYGPEHFQNLVHNLLIPQFSQTSTHKRFALFCKQTNKHGWKHYLCQVVSEVISNENKSFACVTTNLHVVLQRGNINLICEPVSSVLYRVHSKLVEKSASTHQTASTPHRLVHGDRKCQNTVHQLTLLTCHNGGDNHEGNTEQRRGGRQPSDQANWLGLRVRQKEMAAMVHCHHRVFIITQPESWYSFYHPIEGGRLSRPMYHVHRQPPLTQRTRWPGLKCGLVGIMTLLLC